MPHHLPGIVIFAVGLATLSRLTPNIAQFYLTFCVVGLVANATAQFAYARTVLTWFTTPRLRVGSAAYRKRHRFHLDSAAHGVDDRASRLAQRLPVIGRDCDYGFSPHRHVVHNRPEAAIVRAEHHADTSLTPAAAMRTAAFWILAFITILSAFSENDLVTNLASILTQHGVLAASAALALSVRGGAGILGRLGVGLAIDHVSPERIHSLVLALAAAGTLILALASSAWAALLGTAVVGVGLGSEADVTPPNRSMKSRSHIVVKSPFRPCDSDLRSSPRARVAR